MSSTNPATPSASYASSGVSLEAGDETLALVKDAVKATYTKNVLAGLGAFGGLFDISFLKAYEHPVLVASTDSIGTKVKVATALNKFETLGHDLVYHCINDILVQGAKPLFFLDYFATSKLEPTTASSIIRSVAGACQATGTVLLGGETAELPGVYAPGELDLVGTVVGAVDRNDIVTGESIEKGDVVFALMSGGLQTNGFSLARTILDRSYTEAFETSTVGESLLTPHRNYLEPIAALREKVIIKGMAHITGGGIPGNLPRILPEGLGAEIASKSWPVPPIFKLLQERGNVSDIEMARVFNMGTGFLIITSAQDAEAAKEACSEPIYKIGRVIKGSGVTYN